MTNNVSAKSTSRAARHDVKLRSYNSAQPTSECAHDQIYGKST